MGYLILFTPVLGPYLLTLKRVTDGMKLAYLWRRRRLGLLGAAPVLPGDMERAPGRWRLEKVRDKFRHVLRPKLDWLLQLPMAVLPKRGKLAL